MGGLCRFVVELGLGRRDRRETVKRLQNAAVRVSAWIVSTLERADRERIWQGRYQTQSYRELWTEELCFKVKIVITSTKHLRIDLTTRLMNEGQHGSPLTV